MLTKPDKRAVAKIIVVALLTLMALYCLYAVIGQLIIWSSQPTFVHTVTGESTRSAGFILQTVLFAALFAAVTTADILVCLRFYRKKKTNRKRDA